MFQYGQSKAQVCDTCQLVTVSLSCLLVFLMLTLPSQAVRNQYRQEQNQQRYPANYQNEGQRQPSYQQQENPYQQQRNKQQYAYGNSNGMPSYQNVRQNSRDLNMRGERNRLQNNDERNENKCNIFVPTELVEKYEPIRRLNENEAEQTSHIEVCCKDYRLAVVYRRKVCIPKCDNCQNGNCIAPNECQCYEGFVNNENGDCVFSCPMGCLNGQCYLDGSCICDPGYKLDETRKFCRPICSSGCGESERHNCTEPEVCGCAKGYQLTDNGCQPTCDPDCGKGGACREPNKCECKPGYTLKDDVCQAECYQSCDNGICYEQNRCICNSGYTYHEHTTKCVLV